MTEEFISSPQSAPITTFMRFPNQGLTNQAKKVERGKYRILPRHSARVTTPRKQEDAKSQGSFLKILHYHLKFLKSTLAGYLIKVTTFTFQRIQKRVQAKTPERQEGGTKSVKKPIVSLVISTKST
jgi:hypothetical protein